MQASTDYQPFWQGLAEGRLLLQFCPDAGRFQHYPRPTSLFTGKRSLEWRPASGLGTVHAVTQLSNAPHPVAVIELAEGVRLLAGIEGTDAASARIGSAVRFSEQASSERNAPVFEVVASA